MTLKNHTDELSPQEEDDDANGPQKNHRGRERASKERERGESEWSEHLTDGDSHSDPELPFPVIVK